MIVIGSICLALGISLLYRPAIALKINEIARRYVFNDTYVLLNRRKLGLFLILMALVFLLSAVK